MYCKVWYALLLYQGHKFQYLVVAFYLIVSITDPNLQPHETPNEERWSPATQLQQRRQQNKVHLGSFKISLNLPVGQTGEFCWGCILRKHIKV